MAARPETTDHATTASTLDRHASPVSDHRTASGATKDGKATAAMIVGIISIPMTLLIGIVGLVMAIVAIVLGAVARSNIKRNGLAGGGQAMAGIITGVVSIAIFIIAVAVIASSNS